MRESIQLVNPFPQKDYELLWAWLHEHPEANFDDSGVRSIREMAADIKNRYASGEEVWEVLYEGKPVGVIGYIPPRRSHSGQFHGICFTHSMHGKGVAFEAVSQVLERAFAAGAMDVHAHYFRDNKRVDRFLAKLGAVTLNDRIVSRIPRGGKVVTWKTVRISARDFCEVRRRNSNKERPVPPAYLQEHAR